MNTHPMVSAYLDSVRLHLGGSSGDRGLVLEEVTAHIAERLEAFPESDRTPDAIMRILSDIGSPEEIAASFRANNPTQLGVLERPDAAQPTPLLAYVSLVCGVFAVALVLLPFTRTFAILPSFAGFITGFDAMRKVAPGYNWTARVGVVLSLTVLAMGLLSLVLTALGSVMY
ncbi:HAAS signaling domain-containing protein [Timonella senegalensis]|uniref:HAAS signaling domain-containing protein n=1 Tax=Timonella senegalensis TaxID=1465825 RepID=UPI0012B5E1DB|nr:hypothetical protein [Timonella senegalensis]